ncbi:proton-coupled folate transporter isoform X2 [Drosophila willistoni]|nr:proton-coupled folate transporter isoform X2 [Drosophila willistoni]
MVSSLMESFFPAVVSLFFGPWSDKFGRRPILLAAFVGYLSSSIILTAITQISLRENISPWWYILYSVPSIFSGGFCSVCAVSFCYISDVTTAKTRPMRMVLMDAAISVGLIGGSVTSGYIYELTTAAPLFMISGSLMAISLIYLIIWVPESLRHEHLSHSHRLHELFRMDLLKDLWHTCCQSRGHSENLIIWLTMLALTIHIFAAEGDNSVNLLFIREQFDWTVKDFSIFYVARLFIQILGSILVLSVLRRFVKLSIHGMAILCLGCIVLESTTRATAQYSYEIYLGLVLGIMRGVLGPMSKTILSEVTPSSEVGKIFALSSSLQAVTPSLAVPLYTTVYKTTVENYPGAFNVISLGLNFLGFILMNVVYCIQKSTE